MTTPRRVRLDVDEDVDDLDDVLEQFNAPALPPPSFVPPSTSGKSPANIASSSSKPSVPASNSLDDLDNDEFAKELARGMESLMREISTEQGGQNADEGDEKLTKEAREEREGAFKTAWEAMLVEGMNSMGRKTEEDEATSGSISGGEKVKEGEGGDDAFQRTIRKAMEKMKESESTLKADAASGGSDSLEALLGQLNSALGEGEGGDADGELQGLIESMMSQLMSKEILYEPLKELHDKFPSYLSINAAKLSAEDKKRYESQRVSVSKIVAIFEGPSYSDDDVEKGAEIVTLMNEMQSYGSPPAEIMGPLPPGFDLGPDGLPNLGEGCVIA